MVIVVGYWELNWNTPIKEVDLWVFPMRDFGVDKIYMMPVSGINNDKIEEVPNISAIFDKYPDFVRVFVDEEGDEELTNFEHPENVIYIFGRVGFSPEKYKRDIDKSLYIETINNKGLLWGHQAATIVLYDRVKKWR